MQETSFEKGATSTCTAVRSSGGKGGGWNIEGGAGGGDHQRRIDKIAGGGRVRSVKKDLKDMSNGGKRIGSPPSKSIQQGARLHTEKLGYKGYTPCAIPRLGNATSTKIISKGYLPLLKGKLIARRVCGSQ